MGRPSTYQPGKISDWHGLAYRVAVPAQAKDGRWSTKVYLLAPNGKSLNTGGLVLRSHKGEDEKDLLKRVEQKLPALVAEHTDAIFTAVRSGAWSGMTLETYVALRSAVIQHYCRWAGRTETYWAHWAQRLCPAVGGLELLRCEDPTVVDAEIERLTHRKRRKRGYTDAERVDWIILGDILECAVQVDGLLEDNPLGVLARKYRVKMSSIASQDLARRDLTVEELASLLDKCLAHRGTVTYDAMILQVLTGLTIPELCGLDVGDWQQGSMATWLEVTKAYQQDRGKPPVMNKLLDNVSRYRRVVCTQAVEQLLHRLVSNHRGKSRADRSTPLFLTPDGVRLSPQLYKNTVRDTLDEIIHDGAHLSFTERGSKLRGAGKPTIAHTDLLRTTAAYYLRTVCLCNDAELAALLGYHQKHTYAKSYVDWANELVLLYLRNKLERWHGSILHIGSDTADIDQEQREYHLVVLAQPGSRLEIHAPHGGTGMIEKRKEQ